MHGWPDDETLWSDLVRRLEGDYKCARLTLPKFGDQPGSPQGYNFRELSEGFAAAVDQVSQGRNVILVGHDWGAQLCYIFEKLHPNRVQALVTMDVGPRLVPKGPGHAFFLTSYQWWLIGAWAAGRMFAPIGTLMSRGLAGLFRAPHPERTHSGMNYPYFYFWRDMLRSSDRPESLASYDGPKVPTLFLYGGKKPYMFHSKDWVKELSSRPQCQVVEFERSGHWLMLDEPERTAESVRTFLTATVAVKNSGDFSNLPLAHPKNLS